MDYKFAICNSLEDAEVLNQFIFDLYRLKFPTIDMSKWCDPIKHKDQNKWAIPIFNIWIGMYESPVVVEYATDLDGWIETDNEI